MAEAAKLCRHIPPWLLWRSSILNSLYRVHCAAATAHYSIWQKFQIFQRRWSFFDSNSTIIKSNKAVAKDVRSQCCSKMKKSTNKFFILLLKPWVYFVVFHCILWMALLAFKKTDLQTDILIFESYNASKPSWNFYLETRIQIFFSAIIKGGYFLSNQTLCSVPSAAAWSTTYDAQNHT